MASDVQEKANFTRLSRLLVDTGTEALRNTFDGIHPPASLQAVLNTNRTSLSRCNRSQLHLLYPPSGNPPDSKNFDITLLTVLFRNICGFPRSTRWDVSPVDTDRSVPANIVRLKCFRNNAYAHVTSTRVDNATFESLWKKISQSLVELGIPQNDIDDLKTCPLGPEEERYVEMLKECKSQEEEIQCSMQEGQNEIKQQNNEIKQQNNELKQQNNEIKQQNNEIKQQQDELIQQSNEIKQQFRLSQSQQQAKFEALHADFEKRYSKESDKDLLQKLAKHNFNGKIRTKANLFHPGTREWLLQLVDEMVEKEQKWRMLLLTAGPGFGKSVFAAKVCEEFKTKGKLAACHFCDFSDSNLRDPMMMIESLASQMCENIVGFQDKLLDQLRRPHKIRNLKDAFRVYLQNPLHELDFQEPSLVVIDGLDESEADEKNEIINLLADYFPDLPECMKVLVTSRPKIPVAKLESISIQKINIANNNAKNEHDLKRYLKACLPSLPDTILQNSADCQYDDISEYENIYDDDISEYEDIYDDYFFHDDISEYKDSYEVLVSKCEGSFLYACYIQSELLKRGDLDKITYDEIIKFLPEGLNSVYQKYFKRLEEELTTAMDESINVLRILEMFAASKGTLPLDFLTRAFGLAPDCRETKNLINRVNETVSCLLYVSDDDMVTVFHKSVIDWLLAKGYKDHEYAVKVSDGNKLLWVIYEKIFEEIKDNACSGHDFTLTKTMKYALYHGPKHLESCKMKEKFFWLVDVVVIYALLTAQNENEEDYIGSIFYCWVSILRDGVDFDDNVRARISWHVTEIDFVVCSGQGFWRNRLPIIYLQNVLAHSPEDYFSIEEKDIAHLLLPKNRLFVEPYFGQEDVMPLAVWRFPSTTFEISLPEPEIYAVGLSCDKTMAAVAEEGGTISVVSVPRLVKLWDCSTRYYDISCCTFAPDDSFVLFGKLETVLNIAERREVPFFHGNKETFKSCAFSPSGNRLVTSDGSDTVKLWDVAKQSLLSSLCADQDVNWCSFSNTGLFIIAEHSISSVFCVWNAITQQRSDERNVFHSKQCRRCFKPGLNDLGYYSRKPYTAPKCGFWKRSFSKGVYSGVECIVELYNQYVCVKESIHLSTLAGWNFFVEHKDLSDTNITKITMIKNDLLFYADGEKLIVFKTKASTQELPCPTKVFSSSFSPDGSRLATCTSDGCINIWNVDTSKVEQRFKSNHYDLSFSCWWSGNFLFVFCFFNNTPSLTKYPVGENPKILVSESQQVSLSHLLEEFVTFTQIVDFSNGLLTFMCRETDPVKVVDITDVGRPQMVTLPGIASGMSITVSPGASFVFGADENKYYLWRRNTREKHVRYEVHFSRQPDMSDYLRGTTYLCDLKTYLSLVPFDFHCCFSSDSKVAVVLNTSSCRLNGLDIFDLNTQSDNYQSVRLDECYCSKIFCLYKARVVIVASHHFLRFFDMDSGALIESSFQRYLNEELMEHVKLSPNETVLAFPQINNDVTFRRLCIPQSSLLSKIKHEAAVKHKKALEIRGGKPAHGVPIQSIRELCRHGLFWAAASFPSKEPV